MTEQGVRTPLFDGRMKLFDMLGVDGFLHPATRIFGENLQGPDLQFDRFFHCFPGTAGDRKMAAETIPSFGILETFAQFSLSSGGGGHRRSFRRKSVDERDQF